MAANERREPKYATIAADLEAKIKDGEYRPGQALPGQRDLSAAYGVTLMTLRQALALLTDRGLVSQHPGRGTFVSTPKAAYSMGSLRSLSDDLRAQGHTVDTVGTGSFLPERWGETYATADVVSYNGEPRVKVGREFLLRPGNGQRRQAGGGGTGGA